MKKEIVLSLFHGMSCIGLALHELGVEFDLYASEIDRHATKVSDSLFPNTNNLGDVVFVRRVICWSESVMNKALNSKCLSIKTITKLKSLLFLRYINFTLVVAGSPCQGFSFAGKQLNFEDDRSKLFFDFVKIIDHCKKVNPQVKFLLENVKMKKEYEAVISRFMGIDPIEINSSLLSAQSRKRLYWTNIGTVKTNLFGIEEPGIKQPKDKGILLKDILEIEVDEKYYINTNWAKFVTNPERLKKKYTQIDGDKAITQTARQYASWCGDFIIQNGHGFNKGGEFKEKSPTLTSNSWEHNNHVLCVPEATKKGYTEIKDGQCFDATFIDSKTRRGRKMEDKSNCLTASKYDFCQFKDAKIRRLTPTECGRLQTVPEWAIDIMLNCGVSDSQLYKMLGNGWTVDVIAYILKHN